MSKQEIIDEIKKLETSDMEIKIAPYKSMSKLLVIPWVINLLLTIIFILVGALWWGFGFLVLNISPWIMLYNTASFYIIYGIGLLFRSDDVGANIDAPQIAIISKTKK